jgi:hypothetical protein
MHRSMSIFTFNSVPFTCRMRHSNAKAVDLHETDTRSKLGTGTYCYVTTVVFPIISNFHSITTICALSDTDSIVQ